MYKIWIINRPDCCLEPLPNVQVILSNNETSAIAADCEVYDWIAEKRRLLVCKPSIMATNVTILADEANSLSLCEVLITATGEKKTSTEERQRRRNCFKNYFVSLEFRSKILFERRKRNRKEITFFLPIL